MKSDLSVLIVENEPNLGKSLLTMLQKFGYSATIATNNQDAYLCCLQKSYQSLIFNQHCIDGDIVHFLESIQTLVKDKIHVLFLVQESETIPRIARNDKISVSYIQLPTFPEDILLYIARLQEDRVPQTN